MTTPTIPGPGYFEHMGCRWSLEFRENSVVLRLVDGPPETGESMIVHMPAGNVVKIAPGRLDNG